MLAESAGLRAVCRPGEAGVTIEPGPAPAPWLPASTEPALAPAYVLFTSGSTGTPKGVVVPHRAVARLAMDTDYVRLGPDDVVAHASTTSFDATTFEVWGALLSGSRLVVLPRDVVLDPHRLPEELRRRRVSTLFLTTRLFDSVVRARPDAFATLRTLLFGGEMVDPSTVRTVLESGPPARLLHVYGPTETTTFAAWHLVEEVPEDATTVPIGRPLAHTTLHVLDAAGQPVPAGVTGELHIGGDGVALGYLGDEQLTAARFEPDPDSADSTARRYRTGDLVRRRVDGSLEFVGRRDRQVKLRGVRIELAEVEAALLRADGVAAAAAVITGDEDRARLVGYVVPEDPSAAAQVGWTDDLRAELARRLPAILVPSSLMQVDSLPLTPTGKLDERALPVPSSRARGGEAGDPLADRVLGVVRTVLGDPGAGPDDDFFDLGGNSLLAVIFIYLHCMSSLVLNIFNLIHLTKRSLS
jgi:amino acid adenylation domain-containing protein